MAETVRLSKTQRQHRIAGLLEQEAVTSQTQLVELLAAGGVVATQATVSRDLDDLGAIKVRVLSLIHIFTTAARWPITWPSATSTSPSIWAWAPVVTPC